MAAPASMAQPGQGVRTPGDTLQSVRVVDAQTVRLSIYAPKADEVTVRGDFLRSPGPLSLDKDDAGVWSVTIADLTPDLYTYDFTVDGVRTFDPRNPAYKESENGLSNLFILPGPEVDYLTLRDVPHGLVAKVWFHSEVTGAPTRFHVYTPPGYGDMEGPLPVLYLQHGGGDNDASWTTVGRANVILDNLLAAGRIRPMIVVMPMGHPAPGFFMEPGTDADPYYRQLFDEIMPYVETHFKASRQPAGRAYAGLSMGGLQALHIALFHPETFAYVLPLSTGYFPPQLEMLETRYADVLRNPAINNLKLFWIAMGGEQDIAYENGKNTTALLERFGIQYTTHSFPAGHTFRTWRNDLATFAPLLFR